MTRLEASGPELTEGNELTARDLMRHPVLAVGVEDRIEQVWRLLQSQRASQVVVVDAHRCLGIVDAHDLWVSWAFDLEAAGQRSVAHLVTATPCVSPSTPLPQLCQALLDSRDGAVLVLADDGLLQGVVSAADVLRWVADRDQTP